MIIKWIQERIDKLRHIEELEKIREEIKKNSERILQLEETVSRLERIQKNYVPGEIHSKTVNMTVFPRRGDNSVFVLGGYTYIYISGREYKFDGLELNNPSFSKGKAANLINVTDTNKEGKSIEYVLDIDSLQYLEGKKDGGFNVRN